MNATLLSIGDELASGLTVNTNAAWLAQQLAALGISASHHITVRDLLPTIVAAIQQALQQSDLILISGGLGPTADDLTRQAVATALGDELVQDPIALEQLTAWFASRNRPLPPSNLVQVQRPRSATCIQNHAGTAPGIAATPHGKLLFVMPGVPKEMQDMFTRSVLPKLLPLAGGIVTLTHKLHTFGVGESIIGERIKDLMSQGRTDNSSPSLAPNPTITVGTTVQEGIVSVRLYITGTHVAAALARVRQEIHRRLGPLIYGEQSDTLASAVISLLQNPPESLPGLLPLGSIKSPQAPAPLTLATAESCTGGLLAQLLTDIPGASASFLRGYITYSNAAKSDDLLIAPALIAQHGAVSEPVARAMAQGARRRASSTYALSTTGIAGPDGGTPDKPVGTVWIALDSPTGTRASQHIFPGDRPSIRLRTVQMALTHLRLALLNLNPEDVLK